MFAATAAADVMNRIIDLPIINEHHHKYTSIYIPAEYWRVVLCVIMFGKWKKGSTVPLLSSAISWRGKETTVRRVVVHDGDSDYTWML